MTDTKNPQFILDEVSVLEFNKLSFTDKKTGDEIPYRNTLVRYEGKVFKFKVSKDTDLDKYVGATANLVVEMSSYGDSLTPTLRVIGVAK